MQADSLSRFFVVTVTDNGAAWTPPDGALWTVRFGAPQMPAGWYDTIAETGGGTHAAVVSDGNTITVEIAEQALSTPGNNVLTVIAYTTDGYQLAAWPFTLNVQAVPGLEAPAVTEYYNLLTAQVAQALASAQAAAGSATAAASSATLSESWAVGGTGTRSGEDTNNAEYWAQQAQAAAGAGVSSFNGRTGAVTPQSGDYAAPMVGALAQDGTAVAAAKLAVPVNIGSASFDGSSSVSGAQIGIPNFNTLINTDFTDPVNQRGVSGTISSPGYFIDRWKLVSGTVELTDDGLVLNGTIEQILENAIGASFTASASAGTASYDDSSRMFTLVGTGETITWAKLEKGDVATPWQPKGYAAELLECQRFYVNFSAPPAAFWQCVTAMLPGGSSGNEVVGASTCFPVKMRTNPTVTLYGYVNKAAKSVTIDGVDVTGVESTRNEFGIISLIRSAGQLATNKPIFFGYEADAEL